jgi:hypothetical protein
MGGTTVRARLAVLVAVGKDGMPAFFAPFLNPYSGFFDGGGTR